MFNFALVKPSKQEAKDAVADKAAEADDDLLNEQMCDAIGGIIDLMPDVQEGGTITVSVRGNIPLGQQGPNLLVEIAIADPA